MRKLRLVLLRHTTREGDHYDLMLEEPVGDGTEKGAVGAETPETPETSKTAEAPEAVTPPKAPPGPDDRALVTFRVQSPFWEWADGSPITTQRLGAHRRAYLTFEGEISGGRGSVRRVAEGFAVAMEWKPDRAVVKVEWERAAEVRDSQASGRGTLELKQAEGDQWVGTWEVDLG